MGLVLDPFDFAAPRLHAVRDRRGHGLFAGSASSQPRRVLVPPPPLRGSFSAETVPAPVAWLRGLREFASLFPKPCTASGRDALNVAERRRALDALARTTAAVQAAHLVGEGAGHTPARGNP